MHRYCLAVLMAILAISAVCDIARASDTAASVVVYVPCLSNCRGGITCCPPGFNLDWDITIWCYKVTVEPCATAFKGGTLVPDNYPTPTVAASDTFGGMLVINGTPILMNSDSLVAAELTALYPPPAGQHWFGARSNVFNSPAGSDTLGFVVTYHFDGTGDPGPQFTGTQGWFSDTSDDVCGFTVNDADYFLPPLDTDTNVPIGQPEGIEPVVYGFQPNPSHGDRIAARFWLPSEVPVLAELVDVSGRRIHSEVLTGLGRGLQVVQLRPLRPPAAGVYVLRLTADGRTVSARGTIVR
jgi:hypothetical protein